MTTVTFSIPSIHCGHCIHTIDTEISEIEGVVSVKTDLNTKQSTITFQPPATEEKIKAMLAEINYPAA